MRTPFVLLILLVAGLAGCVEDTERHPSPEPSVASTPASESVLTASATLHKLNAAVARQPVVGYANFTERLSGLEIRIQIFGGELESGEHGIHIHTRGNCSGDLMTAGSQAGPHFNPENKSHGQHAGDLGNIEVDADGRAIVILDPAAVNANLTLRPGDPFSIAGRSIIVHQRRDDGVTDPAGNSGPRILCGVIPTPT